MGTLAMLLAGKKIPTSEPVYWADVEGDIENVSGVLKITAIRVKYHLKVTEDKVADAKESFSKLYRSLSRRSERHRLYQD